MSTTTPQLPVLSYAEALNSPSTFIPALRETLLTSGFFYLADIQEAFPTWHADLSAAFEVSRRFFETVSSEEKEGIAMRESKHFRGYSGVGSERTKGIVDLREQIDLGPDTTPHPSSDPIYLSLYGPNLYPPSQPDFSTTISAYRAHLEIIARVLLRLVGESLTTSPELLTAPFYSEDPTTPPYSRMKVVSYPPAPPPGQSGEEGALGVGAHADGGGLTLLAQDSTGGLQVQKWDTGDWIDVTPLGRAELVVNIGQVIENLSADLYTSTTHRVLPVPSSAPRSRLSIPFFFSPVLTSSLSPIPISKLHPELQPQALKEKEVKSEVKRGDLKEVVFGRAAWRGITRSHVEVWERWYGAEKDFVGGPERKE